MKKTQSRHEQWMKTAVALAQRAEGMTRPNPPVGAVVVAGGKVVGAGYHRKAGGPHAEIYALRAAGRKARGASLYVTLEPCCTWGRTPPCTEAVLQAGIASVFVACRDPNPRHSGKGLALLGKKGVKVTENVCAREGDVLIRPFEKWMRTGKPYITLKLAMSLDGKIADRNRRSKWITGPASRKRVHDLRRKVDAILVGANTLAEDDPGLLPVPGRGRRPWRVIVSSDGKLPMNSRVLKDEFRGQTLVATTDRCPVQIRKELERRGVSMLIVGVKEGRVDMVRVMKELGKRGVLHVLCEGGGALAESLIRARLVDEYALFIAPCFIGGKTSVGSVGGQGWTMGSLPRLNITSVEPSGEDWLVTARPA